MSDRSVTYGSYLAVDELLALQRPRSQGPEHDEMLFIVIHQVYELWFRERLGCRVRHSDLAGAASSVGRELRAHRNADVPTGVTATGTGIYLEPSNSNREDNIWVFDVRARRR